MKSTKASADAFTVSAGKEKIARALTVTAPNGDQAVITLILEAQGTVSDEFWATIQDGFVQLHTDAEGIFGN